jgi:predicted transcriptional regulator
MPGYSVFTIRDINDANPRMLGVKLAKICVKRDIPVKDVAEYLGVSRVAVYAWFRGKVEVSDKHASKVHKLIEKLS